MRSPNQQALCGKGLPGLRKNPGGTCLESGQPGSGEVRHPNQGSCPGHLQVQTAWYVFDHIAAFVCVTLTTWFSFRELGAIHCFKSIRCFRAEPLRTLREGQLTGVCSLSVDSICTTTFTSVCSQICFGYFHTVTFAAQLAQGSTS